MKSGAKVKSLQSAALALGLPLLLASCVNGGDRVQMPSMQSSAVADYPVKIGDPYEVDGKTYTPVDVMNYDEVGYASWYGAEMGGRATANGEIFMPEGISGAHRTLPLPSYVEVTSLETGRTILVRLNDRGPFTSDRLIDLSYGAAAQLGIVDQGVAAIRMRRVNPPEQERVALREGRAAPLRLDTPQTLLAVLKRRLASSVMPSARVGSTAPGQSETERNTMRAGGDLLEGYAPSTPVAPTQGQTDGEFVVEDGTASPATAPARSSAQEEYVVQVGAFSSKSNADALAAKIGAQVVPSTGGAIWRVRYGPYASRDAAKQGLMKAEQNGYANAQILRRGSDD
jgi:rare lipoprotein A